MYSYELKSKAFKQLKKLDKPTQKNIIKKLDYLTKQEVLVSSRRLIDHKIGSYRLRVGDYRVIFDIEGQMITVLLVGHRREIYK